MAEHDHGLWSLFSPLLCSSRNMVSPEIYRMRPGVCNSPKASSALNSWIGCADLLVFQNLRMSLAKPVAHWLYELWIYFAIRLSCGSCEGDCAQPWLSWALPAGWSAAGGWAAVWSSALLLQAVLTVKDQDIQRTCSSNFIGSLHQFSASIFNLNYIFIFLVTVTTAFSQYCWQ